MFYDYADGGSWSESTYRANEDDLQAIKFRQRVAIDVNCRDTGMEMLGKKVTFRISICFWNDDNEASCPSRGRGSG